MKALILITTLIVSSIASADEYQFHFVTEGKVKALHDVSVVELQFSVPFKPIYEDEAISGLTGNYTGIEYEQISQWSEGTGEPVNISYDIRNGGKVRNLFDGAEFFVIGDSLEQLIEISRQQCFNDELPASFCNQATMEAWDAELNRAYLRRGGSKNTLLRNSQRAWLKFFEAEKESLREHYSSKEGRFWQFAYQAQITLLIKERTLQLDSALIW